MVSPTAYFSFLTFFFIENVDLVICVVSGNIAFKASDSNSIVEHENK
jgi:hypothetical protein